ncbi:leucine-rich repeat transmembrane protein kinase protein [Tanacetum coccineum]
MINYVSDDGFIDSSEIQNILPVYNEFDVDTQLTTLTSFPQNTRNFYTLKPTQGKGNWYLIRTRFMYGNYDFKSQLPEFVVYLGPDYWDTVKFDSSSKQVNMEIIHVLSSDYIHVCYVNTGCGTPFISTIELRLLANDMYKEIDSGSLNLFGTEVLTSLFLILNLGIFTTIDPPSEVMSDAISLKNPKESLTINWNNTNDRFFMYMHFAEIEILKRN